MKRKFQLCVLFVMLVLVFSVQSFAQFYENSFPDYIEFKNGYYVEMTCNRGNAVLIMSKASYDNIIFDSDNQMYNISNSTIYGVFCLGGTTYPARFAGRNYLQAQLNPLNATWYDIDIRSIDDTNVDFGNTGDPELNNDNLYFDKYQIAVVSLLVAILFFEFLGWFLWHKH